jgi:hypothetical protein
VADFYAPHIIIDYTPAYFLEGTFVGKSGRKAYQAYLKQRQGSERDIFAHQEAIISRIATIKADMMFEDWVTGQLEKFDAYTKMTPEAKLATFGKRPGGQVGSPQPHGSYEIDGKEYRGWQYIPGNMVYRTAVVDQSLLATAFQEAMEDVALADSPTDERLIEDVAKRGFDAIEKYLIGIGPRGGDALRMVRALGARNRTYLIPTEIYEDMKHLTSAGEYSVVTEMMHDARRLTSMWKAMTTQISGGIPFHLRNEFGDVMNMAATAGWKPLTQVPRALKILHNIDSPENLSPFEQRVRQIVLDKAVLEAGYITELNARLQQDIRAKRPQEGVDPFKQLWHDYMRLSAFRELSNRVAMVAYNLQRMEAGNPIRARGLTGQLEGLDPESQIGYVARNGLIDYGDVPDWYRRRVSGFWFPFATFYQKNMNKWARLATAKGLPGKASALPAALSTVAVPVAMLWLWNNYGPFRKVEEGLGYRKRKWFHANLWQWDYDEFGNPHKGLVWSPDHPADLALEGVGADRIMENIDYVRRGILTPREAAAKQVYDFGFGGMRMGERLLNPLAGYFLDVKANNNAYTGRIVPRGEEALPEYDKLKHYYFPHLMQRVLTPLAAYMSEEKGDKPPIEIKILDMPAVNGQDPYDVNLRLPRRPVDVLRGLGFYVVDLDKELDRDWWQLRQSVSADRARQMRKIQEAYISSNQDLATFLGSDKCTQLMDETWRKDFAVDYGLAELAAGRMPPRGTLVNYLAKNPTINIKKAQAQLRQPGLSKEERRQIDLRIRGLKEVRRLLNMQRIEREELPAVFKQILRRVNKKIEKDNFSQHPDGIETGSGMVPIQIDPDSDEWDPYRGY